MRAIKGNDTGNIEDAKALERSGDIAAAAALYEKLAGNKTPDLRVIERLIILYRKLKDPLKEIKYIDAAIRVHESYYSAGKNVNRQILCISNKLNRMLGHVDKKGKPVFKPEAVVKLEMRRQRLITKRPTGKK